jgi:lysophospholipase L1-like esterase
MRGRRQRPRPDLGRRFVGLACVCLLVAGVSGCDGKVARPGPVLLVGDSIFALAKDDLNWVLRSDGWTTTVDAYPGAGIRNGGFTFVDWPSRLRDLVAYVRPAVVVVELGTNGCGECDSIRDAIAADMWQLREVDTVLWLNTATFGPRAAQGRQVNAALEDATERWGNLEILPFDDWFEGETDLIPADDVHPTDAGAQALARHVRDALDDRSGQSDDRSAQAVGLLAVVVAAAVVLRSGSRT